MRDIKSCFSQRTLTWNLTRRPWFFRCRSPALRCISSAWFFALTLRFLRLNFGIRFRWNRPCWKSVFCRRHRIRRSLADRAPGAIQEKRGEAGSIDRKSVLRTRFLFFCPEMASVVSNYGARRRVQCFKKQRTGGGGYVVAYDSPLLYGP